MDKNGTGNGRRDVREDRVLSRARGGDERAVQQLFDHYYPILRNQVERRMPLRLRRKLAASDVIQEAFLGAIQRLAEFQDRGEGSFGGWLATIVDHKVTDQMRLYFGTQKRNVNREVTRSDRDDQLDEMPDTGSVSERARRVEVVDEVVDAVHRLPELDRVLIELIHFQGQSVVRVAELMGATKDATRMRHNRALVRLRRLLLASEVSRR